MFYPRNLWLIYSAAATAVELGALFDDEGGGGYVAADVGRAAEDELLAGANVALHCPIDLCDRDVDDSFCHFSAGADDQCPILRDHVAGEVTVNAEHRFKAHFASEIHHVTDKTKPVIFIHIGSIAVDECRLTAFRNCLSSHWLLPFFLFFSCCR